MSWGWTSNPEPARSEAREQGVPVEDIEREVGRVQAGLAASGYIADEDLSTTLLLAEMLQRPLLLEGDAGVGKTSIAKALSDAYDCPLIRLQCYEGLDVNTAVYEWNYQRQLLAVKLMETGPGGDARAREAEIFSPEFLLPRPLLRAIQEPEPCVLLIDEIDRADEEFEAFLLEVLSDFQISIPELGTIPAQSIPRVILTSNGTRDLSDALRRRCLYFFVDFPSFEKECAIVRAKVPGIDERLIDQIVAFVQGLRKLELKKPPGVAETLDWAAALTGLSVSVLSDQPEVVLRTLGCLLKTREDRGQVTREVASRLAAGAR